jgi:formate dehydrogenase gamma subunit
MISTVALMGTAGALLLHYLLVGIRSARSDASEGVIHRYGLVERLVHAGSLVAFLVAAATGFWPVLVHHGHLAGWMKLVHAGAGGFLGACVVAMGLLWALDATFAHTDWQWLKVLGGHLSRKSPPPAERFDTGQKIFFWSTMGLALTTLLTGTMQVSFGWPVAVQRYALVTHQYAGLFFVLCVAIHVYVMMLAKRGALRAMITGRVHRTWAERYHSLWYKQIK